MKNYLTAEADDGSLWQTIRQLEAQRVRVEAGWLKLTAASAVGLLCVPMLLTTVYGGASVVGLVSAVVWGTSLLEIKRAVACRAALEFSLCDVRHLDAIGPLSEAALTAEGHRGEAVRFALLQLLGQISPRSMPELTQEHRTALRGVLLNQADAELALAILRVYEMTGDRFEREVVRMIAEGPQTRRRDPRVQSAARHCLRAMDPGYAGSGSAELLRPSAMTNETLLRPVVQRHESRPQELLRPAVENQAGKDEDLWVL